MTSSPGLRFTKSGIVLPSRDALRLLGGLDDGAFTSSQRHAQAMLFLEMHRSGILLAQIFWGLWLLFLGSLVFRSGFLPRLLGIAVLIGAAGWLPG